MKIEGTISKTITCVKCGVIENKFESIYKICPICASSNLDIIYSPKIVEDEVEWDDVDLQIIADESGLVEGEHFLRNEDGKLVFLKEECVRSFVYDY